MRMRAYLVLVCARAGVKKLGCVISGRKLKKSDREYHRRRKCVVVYMKIRSKFILFLFYRG